MKHGTKLLAIVCLGGVALVANSVSAQNFGAAKEKVTLQRKLPALVHLPGNSIKVTVTSTESDRALPSDFQALLETELLKDDPDLREDDNPNAIITCRITQYSPPSVITTTAPAVALTKNAPKTQQFQRITGTLTVSFQAKTATGQTLISDNVTSKYDEQFDSSGISTSHGVKGSLAGTWNKLKGQKSEENSPPTGAELRSRLILEAVQQIAEHIVNTNENIDVYLAKQNGALDEGDKDAQTGLWERALETFETATPSPKPEDDAYRLYDIGVAYEALAYSAEDQTTAMKYLDQAAINYGKAVDAKRNEKYFLEPQKRIETAIAHYKELDRQNEEAKRAKEAEQQQAANRKLASSPAAASGLTNTQVLALIKAGVDEDTVIHAIRSAEAVNFDLTPDGEKGLASNGVSAKVLLAMKTQAARKSAAAKPPTHKGLTNAQVVTMVKAGMDEDTIANTVRTAENIDFDLSPDGQQQLAAGGVDVKIITAMKSRAIKRPTATSRPVAQR